MNWVSVHQTQYKTSGLLNTGVKKPTLLIGILYPLSISSFQVLLCMICTQGLVNIVFNCLPMTVDMSQDYTELICMK